MRAFPPRYNYVKHLINRLLAERGKKRVRKNWARNFTKRILSLDTRCNRRIDYNKDFYKDLNAYRERFRRIE